MASEDRNSDEQFDKLKEKIEKRIGQIKTFVQQMQTKGMENYTSMFSFPIEIVFHFLDEIQENLISNLAYYSYGNGLITNINTKQSRAILSELELSLNFYFDGFTYFDCNSNWYDATE
jgi:hypothetical protein